MLALLCAVAFADPSAVLLQAATSGWKSELTPTQMQAVVDTAVDTAAQQFPALFRGLARKKLSVPAFFCSEIQVVATREQWSSACPGSGRAFSRDWSSERLPFTAEDGRSATTSIDHDDDSVTIAFEGDNGIRTTEYMFRDERMIVHVTIRSAQLETPLEWELTYRR